MCDCVAQIDAFLVPHNTKVTVPMFGPQRLFVETMKLDDKKRGKPKAVFATFCPFCGEKYPVPSQEGMPQRPASHAEAV